MTRALSELVKGGLSDHYVCCVHPHPADPDMGVFSRGINRGILTPHIWGAYRYTSPRDLIGAGDKMFIREGVRMGWHPDPVR